MKLVYPQIFHILLRCLLVVVFIGSSGVFAEELELAEGLRNKLCLWALGDRSVGIESDEELKESLMLYSSLGKEIDAEALSLFLQVMNDFELPNDAKVVQFSKAIDPRRAKHEGWHNLSFELPVVEISGIATPGLSFASEKDHIPDQVVRLQNGKVMAAHSINDLGEGLYDQARLSLASLKNLGQKVAIGIDSNRDVYALYPIHAYPDDSAFKIYHFEAEEVQQLLRVLDSEPNFFWFKYYFSPRDIDEAAMLMAYGYQYGLTGQDRMEPIWFGSGCMSGMDGEVSCGPQVSDYKVRYSPTYGGEYVFSGLELVKASLLARIGKQGWESLEPVKHQYYERLVESGRLDELIKLIYVQLMLAKSNFSTFEGTVQVTINGATIQFGQSFKHEVKNLKWLSASSLSKHFEKHGSEFNASDATEYEDMAKSFFSDEGQGTIVFDRPSRNDLIKYNLLTREFGLYRKDGKIITYFIVSPDHYQTEQEFIGRLTKALDF